MNIINEYKEVINGQEVTIKVLAPVELNNKTYRSTKGGKNPSKKGKYK